jgi:hypothetical protein
VLLYCTLSTGPRLPPPLLYGGALELILYSETLSGKEMRPVGGGTGEGVLLRRVLVQVDHGEDCVQLYSQQLSQAINKLLIY